MARLRGGHALPVILLLSLLALGLGQAPEYNILALRQ